MKKRKNYKQIQSVRDTENNNIQNSWIDFDHFWSHARLEYKLNDVLKPSIKLFFDKKGYKKSPDFLKGLKEFGIIKT